MNALYCIPRLKYQYIYISKENRDKILTSSPPPNPFHFKLIFYVLMLQKTEHSSENWKFEMFS